jgi:hypothetical protein
MTPVFDGTIRDSKLFLDKGEKFKQYLAGLNGKRVQVTVEKIKQKRSNQQNRWYWGCILKLISEHTGDTPEDLHEAFLINFAPKHVVGNIVVASGSRYLDTVDFGQYCEKVRQWAAEYLSIVIPDPQEVSLNN